MSSQWLNFKALKAQLKIIDVLNHHGVKLRVRGAQASGFCPLPGHADCKSPSFSVNLTRNCFSCFGCRRSGNQIDLAVLLAGLDPNDTQALRRIALELAQRHNLDVGGGRNIARPGTSSRSPTDPHKANAALAGDRSKGASRVLRHEDPMEDFDTEPVVELNAIVNPPLGFTLQNLDVEHGYLRARGFTPATIEHFGLGFCSKGMLKDRIAIPLHNADGELVGYCGRAIDDAAIAPEHPKYLFPGRREKGKQVLAFRKSMLLYNAHRIVVPADSLVIVEGFAATWWCWQHGIKNVVAIMGGAASSWQIQTIAMLTHEKGKLFVFPDGDEAGVRLARELLPQLAARRWTCWVKLLADEQPTDLDGNMLNELLRG